MTAFRLPQGGLIDRASPLRFSFDGQALSGYAGDTLASALLANGITLVGRSFKYHRPRGIYSAGPEEPNALVTLNPATPRQDPNSRATMVELFEGLTAGSQNCWPSPAFDLMAVNQLFGKLFSAGFYYKTFMGPTPRAWMFYEHYIRKAAGLGKASFDADPDRYERLNAFCDVLVVGSGPAGLSAALAAGRAGARVLLCEEHASLGGSSVADHIGTIQGRGADSWRQDMIRQIEALVNIRVMTRTAVHGYFDGNTLGAIERVTDHLAAPDPWLPRQRHWTVRARQVVIAAGAAERPLVFPGNDRPGVMLASAAARYASRFGVAVGRQVALFTNNNAGYAAAQALAHASVQVVAVIDSRQAPPTSCLEAMQSAGIRVLPGHVVVGTQGKTLRSISVAKHEQGVPRGAAETMEADALGVSGGFTPLVHLASQAGGAPVWSQELAAFVPGKPREDWIAAGACAGVFGIQDAAASGTAAGLRAAQAIGLSVSAPAAAATATSNARPADQLAIEPLWEVKSPGKKFVDLQHDVTADDVELAHREGFRSVEHLKRYTTLGMATDQGKTSNVNGLALMAAASGLDVPAVGSTRFRPPYAPVAIGALAGRDIGAHHKPMRLTAIHDWHVENGGAMVATGLWMRPRAYLKPGETVRDAYIREAAAVRAGAGIVDVSTLGKIDVQGPDAGEFLNRLYVNEFKALGVGKARYGVMLREDGIVFDDGTTWRLGETQYLVTTTTANAAAVLQHMEYYLNMVWPDLKVQVNSVTDQWAGFAVAGPKSREVLEACVHDCDLSNEALPFMGVRHGRIGDVPVLLARLSFSGERAYEVYCGTHFGQDVWNAILDAGKPFGLTPYGIEALGTLRIEKGHVSGPELDGRTTLGDLGLGRMASKKKPFIGQALMNRPGLVDSRRKQLVGLVSLDGQAIRAGSHLVKTLDDIERSLGSVGHVNSTTYSPAVGKQIALGLLEGGTGLIGTRLFAFDPVRGATRVPVEVVSPCFYDPEGSRMHG